MSEPIHLEYLGKFPEGVSQDVYVSEANVPRWLAIGWRRYLDKPPIPEARTLPAMPVIIPETIPEPEPIKPIPEEVKPCPAVESPAGNQPLKRGPGRPPKTVRVGNSDGVQFKY